MAIPTIPDILDGIAAGTCTREQGLVWIDLHVGEAVQAAADLDVFAGRAMQALMADREFLQAATNAGADCPARIAAAAYAQATAMINARP
jgi:hypothetical protein